MDGPYEAERGMAAVLPLVDFHSLTHSATDFRGLFHGFGAESGASFELA